MVLKRGAPSHNWIASGTRYGNNSIGEGSLWTQYNYDYWRVL